MEQKLKKNFMIKTIVVAAAVIAMCIYAFVSSYSANGDKRKEKNRYSEEVSAVIADMDTLVPVGGNAEFRFIYKFYYTYTYDGTEYTERSFDEVNEDNKYSVGDRVTIMIDPSSPRDFYDPKTSMIDDVEDFNVGRYVRNVVFFVIIGAAAIAAMYNGMKKKLSAAQSADVQLATPTENIDE